MQSLDGLVNNVKNAMGDRDVGAWGWTLGEWLKHTKALEKRVEELETENKSLISDIEHMDKAAGRAIADAEYYAASEGYREGINDGMEDTER